MAWNEQNGQTSPTRLRAHPTARLPGHMVPQAFLCLDAVPLTPNGKADRQALPAPWRAPEARDRTFLTPAENGVAGIWEQVLGAEAGERR